MHGDRVGRVVVRPLRRGLRRELPTVDASCSNRWSIRSRRRRSLRSGLSTSASCAASCRQPGRARDARPRRRGDARMSRRALLVDAVVALLRRRRSGGAGARRPPLDRPAVAAAAAARGHGGRGSPTSRSSAPFATPTSTGTDPLTHGARRSPAGRRRAPPGVGGIDDAAVAQLVERSTGRPLDAGDQLARPRDPRPHGGQPAVRPGADRPPRDQQALAPTGRRAGECRVGRPARGLVELSTGGVARLGVDAAAVLRDRGRGRPALRHRRGRSGRR